MAMAITMGMVAWVFVFATEVMVTQGPLSSVHYTYIKRPPNPVVYSPVSLKLGDTTKMTALSRATGLPNLAGDHGHGPVRVYTR